ncbi:DUF192 domain-containing protein|nr:DUF192 domain-containing protein [archaeon]
MIIKNKTNGKVLARNAWVCESLKARCRGLMFRRISEEEGCVLLNPYNDVLGASIHMFFVPQDLEVLWVDEDYRVVSVRKCQKATLNPLTWRTYTPSRPAKYVVELLNAKGTLKNDKIQFIK